MKREYDDLEVIQREYDNTLKDPKSNPRTTARVKSLSRKDEHEKLFQSVKAK